MIKVGDSRCLSCLSGQSYEFGQDRGGFGQGCGGFGQGCGEFGQGRGGFGTTATGRGSRGVIAGA